VTYFYICAVPVIDSRKKRPAAKEGSATGANANASLFEEKAKGKGKAPIGKAQNRLTTAQLRELEEQKEAEVLRGYRRVADLWPRILNEVDYQEEAEREWLFEAEKLVNTFRETRNLFLTSRVRFPFGLLRALD
jgi:general transcription factor 3C polypeptide 3 (transcription factor C subunit 4)